MTAPARTAALSLAAAMVAGAAILWGAMAFAASPAGGALFRAAGAAGGEALFILLLYGLLVAAALGGLRLAGARMALGDRPGRAVAAGSAIGVGGLMLALALAALAGLVRPGGGGGGGIAALLLGTLLTLFQAGAEEVYFRGWLQPLLVRGWGAAAGIGVAALAFALLHVLGGARSPLTLLNLFAGGVLFGLLAWRGGGIAAAAAAHAGWNWAEGVLFGLDPNPGTGSFGALLDRDLVGRALWGGSDEGLNASIAMTIVLVALILPCLADGRAEGGRRQDEKPLPFTGGAGAGAGATGR